MPKNKYKEFIRVSDNGLEKTFDKSIIFEKARWYYRETSGDGRLVVYFRSGIVYHFKDVKPRFAEAFLHSNDQECGTAFNKYIRSQFQIDRTVKTAKFTKMLQEAKRKDKLAKDRAKYKAKKEKLNA